MRTPREICGLAPVIPVIVVERPEDAAPLAKAIFAGGLPVLEVTLRTPVALDAIRAMREACPEAIVGAGTVRSPEALAACIEAGADFGVSPGAPARLMDAVAEAGLPFLPGCATATEAMALADRGYEVVKFFPAAAAGGPSFLKSLASPLPHIGFCPTGGITRENAGAYLRLPNVLVVGGSWVAPKALVDRGDWSGIETLAKDAVAALAPLRS
jgi:2-dehydro-3-deoxyphosphogluconate aldolase/(4S)-4-hydroxy-2-oxoglutarate aldolase